MEDKQLLQKQYEELVLDAQKKEIQDKLKAKYDIIKEKKEEVENKDKKIRELDHKVLKLEAKLDHQPVAAAPPQEQISGLNEEITDLKVRTWRS